MQAFEADAPHLLMNYMKEGEVYSVERTMKYYSEEIGTSYAAATTKKNSIDLGIDAALVGLVSVVYHRWSNLIGIYIAANTLARRDGGRDLEAEHEKYSKELIGKFNELQEKFNAAARESFAFEAMDNVNAGLKLDPVTIGKLVKISPEIYEGSTALSITVLQVRQALRKLNDNWAPMPETFADLELNSESEIHQKILFGRLRAAEAEIEHSLENLDSKDKNRPAVDAVTNNSPEISRLKLLPKALLNLGRELTYGGFQFAIQQHFAEAAPLPVMPMTLTVSPLPEVKNIAEKITLFEYQYKQLDLPVYRRPA